MEEKDYFENLDISIEKTNGINIHQVNQYNCLYKLEKNQLDELKEGGVTVLENIYDDDSFDLIPIYLDSKKKASNLFLKGLSEGNLVDYILSEDAIRQYCKVVAPQIDITRLERRDYSMITGLQSFKNNLLKNEEYNPRNIHLGLFDIQNFIMTFNSPHIRNEDFEKYSKILFEEQFYPKMSNTQDRLEKRIEQTESDLLKVINKVYS